jgi:light-regulated signal transduction histidine kinase (bacteriophytochrome)
MFKNEVELINQDFLVNALFSFYLIASQGNYLQSGKNIIIQSLEKSKAELEEKNKELELSNERLNEYTRNLEKTNRELDKFASVASHDLKAPLRAIGTLSDFIEDDLQENLSGESKSHLATIRGRVRRMESLLDALLLYSKSDRKHLQYSQVNTAAVLEKVVALLRTNRDFRLSISDDMPLLLADEQVLISVFSNLLDNAIKFNDKPVAEISISARETANDWVFNITDNGPGIDSRYHDKIFVIFQTIQPRDEFESIGAGLAITRKIIENKGGRIEVISSPGEGATFSFSLPKGIPKKTVSDEHRTQTLTFADLN